MKYNFLFNDFQPKQKRGVETIIAAGVAAAATVTSAVVTSSATKKANEANANLVREQMAYQTSEREATQEYNTPENQRSRVEQAGFNPYIALANLDNGNTNFQTGVTPATMQPDQSFGNMLQNFGAIPSQIMQYQQMAEQITGLQEANKQARVETLYKGQEKLLQLQKAKAEVEETLTRAAKGSAEYDNAKVQARMLDRQVRMLDNELSYQTDYLNSRNKKERETAELVHNQNRHQLLVNEYQQMYNSVFPKLNEKQLQLLSAQTFQSFESGGYSRQLSESEKVKRLGEVITNGIRANEFKLQDLDLTQSDIQLMRLGKIKAIQSHSDTWTKIRAILDDSKSISLPFFNIGGFVK